MPRCLVALGANLGDRRQTLDRALESLRNHPRIVALCASGWHETLPIGGAPGQGPFLNGAAAFDTSLSAVQLHAALHQLEQDLGRARGERWAARAIDLDLLLYGDEIIVTSTLVVPHPRMALRRFVLEPAVEVAPRMIHPAIGWSVRALFDHLATAVAYIPLLGIAGSGKSRLANSLAREFAGRHIVDPGANVPLGSPSDPPSRIYGRQIQFLDQRAQRLDRRRWPADDVLAISDFYLDQCLAYARIELDPAAFETFEQAWRTARQQVVSAKFVVVLDLPGGWPGPPHGAGRSGELPAGEDRLRSEILELAQRREMGPVLYAGGLDAQAQLNEISAAIQAMK